MIEFQSTGRLDAAHEGFDRGPVLWQQAIDMRASQYLFRMRRGQAIQGLVQVHDQTMQAVALAVGKPSQSGDLRKLDRI